MRKTSANMVKVGREEYELNNISLINNKNKG